MSTIKSFFFNDTATTEIYTLSLHDALPICEKSVALQVSCGGGIAALRTLEGTLETEGGNRRLDADVVAREIRITDRKSTRLNSSHSQISYAVFCLQNKKDRLRLLTWYISHE